MKTILLLMFFLKVSCVNGQTITPEQAKNYAGQHVKVCGQVGSTFMRKKGNVFLNFGNANPNQIFSGVIYSKNTKKFDGNPTNLFKGKHVCVSGIIKLYKNKPEVEVADSGQLIVK